MLSFSFAWHKRVFLKPLRFGYEPQFFGRTNLLLRNQTSTRRTRRQRHYTIIGVEVIKNLVVLDQPSALEIRLGCTQAGVLVDL